MALARLTVAIPLKDAMLCLSCECVWPLEWNERHTCPLCDDEHGMPLQTITGTIKPTNKNADESPSAV